jgi:protein-S-isoprenylcysteine O-methyltransferase Ste14
LRRLISFIIPFLVVVIIPQRLRSSPAAHDTHWSGKGLGVGAARLAGGASLLFGFGLFAWCVGLFNRESRGTIMPWEPIQRLVVVGPYRHVRNPMISGVLFMLLGQALFFGSRLTAAWAGLFFLINHLYFIRFEEPGLERRFGDDYRRYQAAVPRWRPHVKPGSGE